ncbi:hypothetical protein CVS40_11240 [Lucilia cuprina]|nr:hypothetical protein CVS40_11240 [Lucilia cuprina]
MEQIQPENVEADVSDPPKCLSFNEAGEIEGLNERTLPHLTNITYLVETSESPQRPLTCEILNPF